MRRVGSGIMSIEDLPDGARVPLIGGNYGLYEKGAMWDFELAYNVLIDEEGNRRPFEDIDLEALRREGYNVEYITELEDLAFHDIDFPPLKDGTEGEYFKVFTEHAPAIWDLGSDEYVPLDCIDWGRIYEDPDSVIIE